MITEVTCRTHRHLASAAASLVGRAGDSVTAGALARAVDDREMRCIAGGFYYA